MRTQYEASNQILHGDQTNKAESIDDMTSVADQLAVGTRRSRTYYTAPLACDRHSDGDVRDHHIHSAGTEWVDTGLTTWTTVRFSVYRAASIECVT